MKIAVLLRGYIYKDIYKHWTNKYYNIDYINNFNNVKEQILSKENIDLYIVTYENIKYDKKYIYDVFNPKDLLLLKDNAYKQMDCLEEGLKMIKNNNTKYSHILITRFDLFFKKNIYELDYNFDKINFIWNEINEPTRVGDCLHFLNYNLLDIFIDALNKCKYKVCCHYLLDYVDKKYINIIFKDNQWSNSDDVENPLYIIIRNTILTNRKRTYFNFI